jgi:rubrerythrin
LEIRNTMETQPSLSRRHLIRSSAIVGFSAALSLPAVAQSMAPKATPKGDLMVLNSALYYEYQAIWAYGVAAGKLSDSAVGKAVLALGLANQSDHKEHAKLLDSVVRKLGGKPTMPQKSYDLSSYLQKGEGNLDSDVNIAKLALALEVDAAIAYTQEAAKLKTPDLITAGASIAVTESAHATAIRAAMVSLGLDLAIVPAPFLNSAARNAWIVKV